MPVMVPPVPIPATKWVTVPSVCAQISGPGGGVVRGGVLRVRVLVGLPAAGDLGRQPARDAVVGVGVIGRDRAGADHHLGAVGAQHADLVLGHLVRADEDAPVAALAPRRSPARPRCCPRWARRSCRRAAASPDASAAATIRSAMRSLTEPPGLKYSTLASTAEPGMPPGHRPQPDQRGVPHQPAQ